MRKNNMELYGCRLENITLCVCCPTCVGICVCTGSSWAPIDKAAAGMSDTPDPWNWPSRNRREVGGRISYNYRYRCERLATGMPVIDEGQSPWLNVEIIFLASHGEYNIRAWKSSQAEHLCPDLNIPYTLKCVLSFGDRLLINVWGDSNYCFWK